MKNYKAFISQGAGCDYTIACGETIININAESIDEARQKLLEIVKEEYSPESRRLESAELFEVAEVFAVDLTEIYKRIDNAENEAHQKRKEEAERKEFERLRSKFGYS